MPILETRWKNPQGSTLQLLYLWAQDLIKELRSGEYQSRGPTYTKTGDFTLADWENWIIVDNTVDTIVTLPSAGGSKGRWMMFKSIQSHKLDSASANVVPLAGGAPGTAILTPPAGSWAFLVSDGTNWQIMAGV